MPTKKWVDKIEMYNDKQLEAEIERLDKIRNEQHNEIKALHRTLRDAHRCMQIHDTQGAYMILEQEVKGPRMWKNRDD